MEATKALKNKVTVIGIISVLLMVSLIGTAYAYSTSVTSSGDISGSYLSVDILKNDSAMDKQVTKLLDEDGKYTYSTGGDKYYVHVESNKSSVAWLYGYFTVDNSTSKFSGVLINTITVTLKVDDTTSVDMTLYRDAYKDSFHTGTEFDSSIALTENANGTYSKDLQITAIKVNYITDFDSMTSVNVTKSDGTSGSVTIADGKALSNLSFIFHASPQALLHTSA